MNSALNDDPELQRLMAAQELFENIKRIQNICWEKCMSDGVDSRLSSRQESCLNNCADRYVDAVIIGTNLLNQRISGQR